MKKIFFNLMALVVMGGFSTLQARAAEEDDYDYDYPITMYTPGLSVDTDVFAQYASFKASGYPLNFSERAIEEPHFAFALTDSEGKVKELISDYTSIDSLKAYNCMPKENVDCTISVEIELGDWVCMVYQNHHTDDDGWKVIEPYTDDIDIPWRIIITEDNLGEPLEYEFTFYQYTNGLTVSTNLFYTGVEFTASSDPLNFSDETVDTYLRYALTDSDGEVKEWISDYMPLTLPAYSHTQYYNTPCTITGSISAGDRIRLFYQGSPDKEDFWKVMGPYDSDVQWEVEITEDMIIDYVNDSLLRYKVLSENTVEVTSGDGDLVYNGYLVIPKSVMIDGTEYTVVGIGYRAFADCTELNYVDTPNTVTYIAEQAFSGCSGLASLTLGSSVGTIGDNAFSGCQNITSITTLNPTPPTLSDNAFDDYNATLYVPAGTIDEYERAWSSQAFSNYNELGYTVLKITLSDDGEDGYSTYYDEDYDIDLTDTGIKAYWAETVDEGTVTLTNIGTTIPAKTAVVLTGALTDYAEAQASSPTADATAYTTNLLHGHSTTGMLEEEGGDYLYYMLTTNTSGTNVGFYYGATDGAAFSSKANKAWLAVPSGQSNSLSIKFKDEIDDEDDTTGISSVEVENEANTMKGIYTIQGIRVNDMSRPGVYIVNGKKILVK